MRTRNTDKEELVKQTAIKMLVSDGFEGFSVNKLAKACDISVATLYIYYKDKEDLIIRIAIEEGQKMNESTLANFDPEMPFAAGLRRQWENRFRYHVENPNAMLFFEQLRSSPYQDRVFEQIHIRFKAVMEKFTKNAVARGELNKMPLEVYWAIAFAPLYTLIRFHDLGTSIGGKKFTASNKILWETFDLVLKALRP